MRLKFINKKIFAWACSYTPSPRRGLGYSDAGFAALFMTILILVVIFGIAVSISILTYGEQKILKNITKSNQAYYTAEAGIEDALLRLEKNMNWSSPYTLSVGNSSATIEISEIIGGSRMITSEGNVSNRIRKIQIVYQVTAEEISFYYGAQIGDGGIEMVNKSRIEGNVFSNGSIVRIEGANVEITGTAWVAINGNKLNGLNIGEDAYVHTCVDSQIGGTLTYVSGGSVINCTAGESIKERPNEIDPRDLPIPPETINSWKDDALSGGIISGDYILSGTSEAFLGPKKIEGNMAIQDKSILTVTGTIWVTGDITIENTAKVRLDKAAYGSLSGVIIADGKIILRDSASVEGSGEEGSYLMLLSTNTSLDAASPAIFAGNSSETAIIYTSDGLVVVANSIELREVTGYKLYLSDSATVVYEVGLEDASFTSGPGGSWEVVSWKEIE